jgi:hypothetical protein
VLAKPDPLLLNWGDRRCAQECVNAKSRPLALQSLWSFSVRLKRRFSVPACTIGGRRAQRRSRLAAGHRGAARSGLDGREHGASLAQAGARQLAGGVHYLLDRRDLRFGLPLAVADDLISAVWRDA